MADTAMMTAPPDSAEADDPVGDYDDPTAVLSGEWGRNQHGKGLVYSRNPTEKYFQEVQIRLRHTIRPNFCCRVAPS